MSGAIAGNISSSSPQITAQNDGIKDDTLAKNFADAREQNDIDSADTDNDKAHGEGKESNADYQKNKISDDIARLHNDSGNLGQSLKDMKKLKDDEAAAPGMGLKPPTPENGQAAMSGMMMSTKD